MKVAVIGLGDIARKAYLPVLAGEPDLELHLVTRNLNTLRSLSERYRPAAVSTSVEQAIESGLDAAFVSAATVAHPAIVGALIDAGVATYVDKPITDSYATSAALVGRAEADGVSLMVGFNRRYAPAHREAHLMATRDLVVYQKHRPNLPPDQARRMVFDDFVHIADTLRFFADGPVTTELIGYGGTASALEWVSLTLLGDGFTCFGAMHRGSGAAEEVLEVVGGGAKIRVDDLGDLRAYPGAETFHRRPGWASAPETRGFTAICREFLGAVRQGEVLSAADALETHALCERIVAAVS